ncbi:hypothetical protein HanPI659440_Chr01g0008701 [Helianthus annuus]|nr:hypothetical protein HanPI659440_Chr01g0008701 [Helianthus annuus]
MSHTKTRMQKAWTIEEVAFNIPGLSIDCFIPLAELCFGDMSDASEYSQEGQVKTAAMTDAAYWAKVGALERRDGLGHNVGLKRDVEKIYEKNRWDWTLIGIDLTYKM